jgi:hypothetical protein
MWGDDPKDYKTYEIVRCRRCVKLPRSQPVGYMWIADLNWVFSDGLSHPNGCTVLRLRHETGWPLRECPSAIHAEADAIAREIFKRYQENCIEKKLVPDTHEQKKISVDGARVRDAIKNLTYAFDWKDTADGPQFWQSVVNRLIDLRMHETSDGKPLKAQEPQMTDEWLLKFIANHGRRPKVHVRDDKSKPWSRDALDLQAVKTSTHRKFYTFLSSWVFCKLADGEPLE